MSKRSSIFLVFIFIISFATRFVLFGYPAQVVFDETHYGQYATYYMMGNYYFDLHPPLAKLLIAFTGEIAGYKPGFMFPKIGTPYPDYSYVALRFLPSLFGSLLPAIIFLLCLELSLSEVSAFFAGLLIVFENSLIIESRFILINIFLVVFGFAGIWLYLMYRRKKKFWLLCISLILCACALSVKWTGLSFLAMAALIESYDLYISKAQLKKWLSRIGLFIAVPFFIYVSVFALHFYLLPKSGVGDGFMSPEVQKTLYANAYDDDPTIKPANFLEKFVNLNHSMYSVNYQSKLAKHAYSSAWYTWPLELRPVYYWWDFANNERIYLLGNPADYWLGSAAILFGILLLLLKNTKILHNVYKKINKETLAFILIFYFANWLPFMFIKRSLFLYHYFPSLIMSCIMIAFLSDQIKNTVYRRRYRMGIMVAVLFLFICFVPLTYGLPLSSKSLAAHFWFKSWK